jgi:hypothetical protein
MRYRQALVAVLAATCALTVQAQPSEAKKALDRLTGDAKAPASANPQCKMFSPAEIKGFLGAAVGAGENAAGGAGCMWSDKTDEFSAIVTIVGARYYEEPSLVKGFKRLPGIGQKAWVAPDGGWRAGAVDGDAAVMISLSGKTASEAGAVAMLQEAIKRRRK